MRHSTIANMTDSSLADGLQNLDLNQRRLRSTERKSTSVFVETPEALKVLVELLYSLKSSDDALYMDIEGVSLSRHGSISIIQIWVPPVEQAFLVDVFVLGAKAFSTELSNGQNLKHALEDAGIKKYLFDVRNDADALFGLYGVQIRGVVDVQLLELACRQGPKYRLCGLATCMRQEDVLSGEGLLEWEATKQQVVEMFDPKLGGSYEVFNLRPLPQILVDYCMGDVRFLAVLSRVYESRLTKNWLRKVRLESAERLKQSRASTYEHQGRHKTLGPKSWRYPPKKEKKFPVPAVLTARHFAPGVSSCILMKDKIIHSLLALGAIG